MHTTPLAVRVACCLISLLCLPSSALACNIPIRTVHALNLSRADLRRPLTRRVARTGWRADTRWHAVAPDLSQFIQIRGGGLYHGVSYARQNTLSIDAPTPDGFDARYIQSEAEGAPACQLIGQGQWQPPHIWIAETAREVRISAASRLTVGSTDGCEQDWSWEGHCPILTRKLIRLRAPLGSRRLIFETFKSEESGDRNR
jgi:hypothetical protein